MTEISLGLSLITSETFQLTNRSVFRGSYDGYISFCKPRDSQGNENCSFHFHLDLESLIRKEHICHSESLTE